MAAHLATAAFVLAAMIAAADDGPLLVFSGNAVLDDEVYRAVLDLPEEARATPSNARLVRARLLDFLRRAGYELATVKTKVEDSHILVEIDEGRVDKVIVVGEGAYQTLRLKLELSIPYNVFNRRSVDTQLKELSAKYGFKSYAIELVPVSREEHVGPQIELGKIQEYELIAPERPYELRIVLQSRGFETGFSPEVSFNSLEGVGTGARYRLRGVFFTDDRAEMRVRLAGTLRKTIDERKTRPVLSRAFLESKWFTPPLIGKNFRSFVWGRADLLNRQRSDLGIESFFYASLDASVNVQYQFSESLAVSLGAGLEHRRLFAIDRAEMTSPFVDQTPRHQTRPFGVAAVDITFSPNEPRRDRRDFLQLEARGYARGAADRPHSLRLNYVFASVSMLGWHELWVRSRGSSTHGDSLFPDEIAIGGQFLRGPFTDTFYVRRLASINVELRWSLARDFFKVSVFHDLAGFGLVDREADQTRGFMIANAFGLGGHVLIIDAFQLDAYYGFGFASDHRFDHGFTLQLQQAF